MYLDCIHTPSPIHPTLCPLKKKSSPICVARLFLTISLPRGVLHIPGITPSKESDSSFPRSYQMPVASQLGVWLRTQSTLLHAEILSGIQAHCMLSPSYESTWQSSCCMESVFLMSPTTVALTVLLLPPLHWSLSLGREGGEWQTCPT